MPEIVKARDGQTDRQTDGQTDGQTVRHLDKDRRTRKDKTRNRMKH